MRMGGRYSETAHEQRHCPAAPTRSARDESGSQRWRVVCTFEHELVAVTRHVFVTFLTVTIGYIKFTSVQSRARKLNDAHMCALCNTRPKPCHIPSPQLHKSQLALFSNPSAKM